MLKQVRGWLKGAVAWIFGSLLVLSFMFFGVPEVQQFAGNAAVTVGGESYSPQYVQNEFNRAVQIQAIESGGAFSREEAIQAGLPAEILATITSTAALNQFTNKIRLSVPRSMMRDYLQANENLQNPVTGEFDRSVLLQILQRYNISVEEFEKRISGELLRAQLIDSLVLKANAPKTLVDFSLMRESERREISYLVVTEEMAGKAAEPTPDDLTTYYEANPQTFTAPEYRTIQLLAIRNEDFREGIEVSEDDLRQLYETNRARLYEKPETRTIYQITFDSEAEAQASAAALKQGKTFEAIAIENGRTLDAVTFADARQSDILDPGVGEAAFAQGLDEGAVIDPVEGLFGWTVVQIAGITAPELVSFEDAREEIETGFLAQDTRRAMLNAIDEVEEARDTGASLAAAAQAAGLEAVEYGPLDRLSFAPGGAIIDAVPGEALAEAFLLEEDQQSEALPLADQAGWVFVSVKEIRSPVLRPFEDVRDDVDALWRKDEREQRLAQTVNDIRAQVAAGASLADVSSQFDRAPTTLIIDRRFESEAISADLRERLFAAAPDALVTGAAAIGEAQIIAEIETVAISTAGVPTEQASFYGQYLGYQLDQELVDAFLASVQNEIDIKINQTQIDAIFAEG